MISVTKYVCAQLSKPALKLCRRQLQMAKVHAQGPGDLHACNNIFVLSRAVRSGAEGLYYTLFLSCSGNYDCVYINRNKTNSFKLANTVSTLVG